MTTEELRQFIATNDSFGFEMRVCAALAESAAMDVQHGATYSDPVTGIPRQFDFRFHVAGERRYLRFALECKNIDPTVPVIVCGRSRPKHEAYHEIIVSRTATRDARSAIKRVQAGPSYREAGFVGKSVLKPSRDGAGRIKSNSNDGDIHERWAQAIASSYDLVLAAARTGNTTFTVVVPALVVPDGSLYSLEYDARGNARGDPQKCDHCTYYIGHKCQVHPEDRHEPVVLSHIHFFTLSGLINFLGRLAPRVIDWDEWIPQEVFEAYRP